MLGYSFLQWVQIFIIYCFFGWCFESSYVSVCKRRFVNRGFMRGPYLPIYGSGAVVILLACLQVRRHLILVGLLGMMSATLLELVTGILMEKLFLVRYWDYTENFCNFKGYICLKSSLCWGVLSIVLVKFIHPLIENIVFWLGQYYILSLILTCCIAGVMAADFVISFHNAIQLRKILEGLERAREELGRIRAKMDELVKEAGEQLEEQFGEMPERLERLGERFEEMPERLSEQFEGIQARLEERFADMPEHSERLEAARKELQERREQFELNRKQMMERRRQAVEHRRQLMGRMNGMKRDMIHNNPSARSHRFPKAFEELKAAVEHYYEKNKKNEDET